VTDPHMMRPPRRGADSPRAALLAMAALGSVEVALPRGVRTPRGQLVIRKPDHQAECAAYVGKAMRHRFTGQVRDVFHVDAEGVCWGQRTRGDHGRGLPKQSHRKAVQWLRNADPVTEPRDIE